jgi:hypothetical protein
MAAGAFAPAAFSLCNGWLGDGRIRRLAKFAVGLGAEETPPGTEGVFRME